MNEKQYQFHIYLAHTGVISLYDFTLEEVKEQHRLISKGDMFVITLNDGRPWLINPHYVIHTEVHSQP